MRLSEQIEARAHQMGFDVFGWTPVTSYPLDRYRAWLDQGFHGTMGYLAGEDAIAKRGDLSRILPAVRAVITVGSNYHTRPLPAALDNDPARGVIASYAWGDDYHDVLVPRLRELAAFIEDTTGQPVANRAYVDTGPTLERAIAAQASNGFIGKNTHLIHPDWGSWLFLGELLIGCDLEHAPAGVAQSPAARGTCGRCTRCLDACPTGALVAPYVLDARRCISYLTIELKDPIPPDLRPLLGNRVFGCDICQEVCPWNKRFAQPAQEPHFQPRSDSMAPQLLDLMALDDEAFRRRFRASPVKRAKRRGLLRSVAVALGNWGDPAAVPVLASALNDTEPLIRGHAAWALGRTGPGASRQALREALETESDVWVRTELAAALRTR